MIKFFITYFLWMQNTIKYGLNLKYLLEYLDKLCKLYIFFPAAANNLYFVLKYC